MKHKKRKAPWWGYVKNILKQYPMLCRKHDAALEPRLSPVIGVIGHGSTDDLSPVERCVIHDLPERDQVKYDAIQAAIKETKVRHPEDCQSRLKVIELVYWKRTHTIEGAASEIPVHRNTAGEWQAEFIRLVAEELDLP